MTLDFTPAPVDIPEAVLDDLRERLARTRLPNQLAGVDWQMGTELGYLETLLAYWKDTFDWRAQEARFNAFEPTATEVDGQRIHFLHARSPEPNALPLLISHGWPGSVTEFLDVLGPLSNPRAHGGDPADAFHVVAPSLPGYGFSGPTHERGWHPRRMAEAFTQIMWDLGYNRYGAQGGDWGSIVSQNVADLDPEHVCGLHLNFITVPRPQDAPDPRRRSSKTARRSSRSARPAPAIRRSRARNRRRSATRSKTLRRVCARGSSRSSPRGPIATATSNASSRKTSCSPTSPSTGQPQPRRRRRGCTTRCDRHGRDAIPSAYVGVPTGVANYPGEVTRTPRSWAEHRYNITHWTEQPHGGHFAAMQVPDLFVADVREFFRTVR